LGKPKDGREGGKGIEGKDCVFFVVVSNSRKGKKGERF
jgi:hypothetical protein